MAQKEPRTNDQLKQDAAVRSNDVDMLIMTQMNLKVQCWVKMISNRKRSKTQLQVQKLKLHTHRISSSPSYIRSSKTNWQILKVTSMETQQKQQSTSNRPNVELVKDMMSY